MTAALLRAAVLIANASSHDGRTKNAAILHCFDNKMVSAVNHFPVVSWLKNHAEAPSKYTYIEHAERAVIYGAARHGVATCGAVMYCPWFACPDCARAIIAAGITRVVGSQLLRGLTPERWRLQVQIGDGMLQEAGVEVQMVTEPLGVTIRFDGREVEL